MQAAPITELISAGSIRNRVAELGAAITLAYADMDEIVVICVLKGGFVFAADLVRQIARPCRIEFIRASSYASSRSSSGHVSLSPVREFDLKGRHVLLIDEIVDTGLTISRIVDELRQEEPASIRICALLDKPDARELPVEIDHTGFTIPPLFVVGYGLDEAERYRNLPFIGLPSL